MFDTMQLKIRNAFRKSKKGNIVIQSPKVDIVELRGKLQRANMMDDDGLTTEDLLEINCGDFLSTVKEIIKENESLKMRDGFFDFEIRRYPDVYNAFKLSPAAFQNYLNSFCQKIHCNFKVVKIVDEATQTEKVVGRVSYVYPKGFHDAFKTTVEEFKQNTGMIEVEKQNEKTIVTPSVKEIPDEELKGLSAYHQYQKIHNRDYGKEIREEKERLSNKTSAESKESEKTVVVHTFNEELPDFLQKVKTTIA